MVYIYLLKLDHLISSILCYCLRDICSKKTQGLHLVYYIILLLDTLLIIHLTTNEVVWFFDNLNLKQPIRINLNEDQEKSYEGKRTVY